MSFFGIGKQSGGFSDVIRCDEPSYLIWKWHPAGSQQGNNRRENAIRWGSSLRVKDGEVAVFVYPQFDGSEVEYFEGPCDTILETANLPVLANLIGLAYDGGTPFQAEVYFINLARIIQVKFGVPYFDVYDPRFMDFGVPVAVRGTISFHIVDYRAFIKLHRLGTFSLDDFQRQIRDAVSRYVKDCVANAPAANNIPVIQIETKTAIINDEIEFNVGQRLRDDFGVEVSGIDIAAIEIDKASEGYRQLMAVTKNVTAAKVEADTQDYAERLRIQREEAQYAARKQTQSANIGAFQVEKQAEVGVAGAQALGQMNAGSSGNIDHNAGSGFNMAAIMAGMAVGGAVGQNIAGAVKGTMNGLNQSERAQIIPPTIPCIKYYIAVEGKASGPFDLTDLEAMILDGRLTKQSFIWKVGMDSWAPADSMNEINQLFTEMPPIPPSR